MVKHKSGNKLVKKIMALGLSVVMAMSVAFVGTPLSSKAEEKKDTEPDYTINITVNGDLTVNVPDGGPQKLTNNGVLMWPNQKIVWTGGSTIEPNTFVRCHHSFASTESEPRIYKHVMGFKFVAANEAISLDDLGVVDSKTENVITGGTYHSDVPDNEQLDLEFGKIEYDDSLIAKKLIFVEYGESIGSRFATKCDCEANVDWNVYAFNSTKFKVHEVSIQNVNIEFDADAAFWGDKEHPTSITIDKANSTYNYDIPTKVGYEFDGFEFTDKAGNDISGVLNDSKDGTITFAGINESNWKVIDEISRNGVIAKPTWKFKKITINYDLNGGVGERLYEFNSEIGTVQRTDVTYNYKDDKDYFSDWFTVEREGYTFDGWYMDDQKIACLADIPESKSNPEQIYDVKAKWTLVKDPGFEVDSKTKTVTIKNASGFPESKYVRNADKIIIANGIKTIPQFAFSASNVKTIVLPTGLETISDWAFDSCGKLEKITVPNSVTEIGNGAFAACVALKEVELPSGISKISQSCFTGCDSLESIEIPNGVTVIETDAFYSCDKLETVTLYNSVKSIQIDGFDAPIKNVNFYGTEDEWAKLCSQSRELAAATVTYATPHVHSAVLVKEVAATCTSTGVKAYYTCSCGKSYEDKDCKNLISDIASWKKGAGLIAKKSHSISTSWSTDGTNHWHVCTVCGTKTNVEKHSGVLVKEVPATCTSTGVKAYYTCSCGKNYEDKECKNLISDIASWKKGAGQIAKKSHSISTSWTTDGTNHWHVCTVCGTKTNVEKHKLATTTTPATQGKDGKIETKCSICAKVTKTETIKAIKSVTLQKTSYVYDGKVKKPAVTVKDSAGNIIATDYYTVTYPTGCIKVGSYKVTVVFKGKYSGTTNVSFEINPKKTTIKSVAAKKDTATVKWAKQSTEVTGYEIWYSTSSKFSKDVKKVIIKSKLTTSTKLTKLKKGKTYYVKIRTYKTVNGKKYYSEWSAKKSVKIKK